MMGRYIKNIAMAILACLASLLALSGCTPSSQAPAQGSKDSGAAAPAGTYRPSDLAIKSQERYEYPEMGFNFTVPKSLLEQMDQQEVAMVSEAEDLDTSAIRYAFFSWNLMTQEQKDAEVESKGNGFYDWVDGLERIGTLGVYYSSELKGLDSLTKCREHTELGKSSDGSYTYVLSINPDIEKGLADMLRQIEIEVTGMEPAGGSQEGGSLGSFTMQDIYGNTYTEGMFQDNKLTMVNIFATWCSPCINEIPDLEKLNAEMSGEGVAVVGIVLDAIGSSGDVQAEAVEKAKLLAERTKASYPFLIPDAGLLNGRLKGVDAVPETFFVDKDGDIVGQAYSGSHSLEGWKEIVQTELANIGGGGQ